MQLASEVPPEVDDEVVLDVEEDELEVDDDEVEEELAASELDELEASSPPHALSAAAVPALAMNASARRRANISRPIACRSSARP